MRCLVFALFVLLLANGPAQAHRLDESYIYLNVTDTELTGRFEITGKDLGLALPQLDGNEDGLVSPDEITAGEAEIAAYLTPRLEFFTGETRHPIVMDGLSFLEAEPGTFAQLGFTIPTLGAPPKVLEVSYRFLFDGADRFHRGFALIESNPRIGIAENESSFSLIFSPGNERQTLYLDGSPWTVVFSDFVRHGIWHILIGYDHILFLCTLLLPAVLVLRGRAWEPADTFGDAFLFVVKVISLFTVAHAITLTLSVFDLVSLPVRLVEAVIALSIAVVAANNIRPFLMSRTWAVVFVFGMVHGFGFANVLDPLGINRQSTLAALAGFNLGVELGQILIIAILLPALFLLRSHSLYQPLVLRLGSACLIFVAGLWFVERTFDLFGPITQTLFGIRA
ncbi:MAG: HupE/UreJ family protein [Pseudomonadota bacterium]